MRTPEDKEGDKPGRLSPDDVEPLTPRRVADPAILHSLHDAESDTTARSLDESATPGPVATSCDHRTDYEKSLIEFLRAMEQKRGSSSPPEDLLVALDEEPGAPLSERSPAVLPGARATPIHAAKARFGETAYASATASDAPLIRPLSKEVLPTASDGRLFSLRLFALLGMLALLFGVVALLRVSKRGAPLQMQQLAFPVSAVARAPGMAAPSPAPSMHPSDAGVGPGAEPKPLLQLLPAPAPRVGPAPAPPPLGKTLGSRRSQGESSVSPSEAIFFKEL